MRPLRRWTCGRRARGFLSGRLTSGCRDGDFFYREVMWWIGRDCGAGGGRGSDGVEGLGWSDASQVFATAAGLDFDSGRVDIAGGVHQAGGACDRNVGSFTTARGFA